MEPDPGGGRGVAAGPSWRSGGWAGGQHLDMAAAPGARTWCPSPPALPGGAPRCGAGGSGGAAAGGGHQAGAGCQQTRRHRRPGWPPRLAQAGHTGEGQRERSREQHVVADTSPVWVSHATGPSGTSSRSTRTATPGALLAASGRSRIRSRRIAINRTCGQRVRYRAGLAVGRPMPLTETCAPGGRGSAREGAAPRERLGAAIGTGVLRCDAGCRDRRRRLLCGGTRIRQLRGAGRCRSAVVPFSHDPTRHRPDPTRGPVPRDQRLPTGR